MDLRSVKPLFGFSVPLVLAVLATGCGNYTSDYVPPRDGRARAVWQQDRVVASMPDGAGSAACSAAVYDVQEEPSRYRTYYGGSPTIIVWRPWIVVTGGTTVSSSPSRLRTPATASVKGGGSSGGGSVGSIGSGSSGGGGGGGGDIGKAAVVLVVVAMLTLPFITLGLGLGRPEPSKQVAEEIDKVNAYNDLARLNGSPCAVAGAK